MVDRTFLLTELHSEGKENILVLSHNQYSEAIIAYTKEIKFSQWRGSLCLTTVTRIPEQKSLIVSLHLATLCRYAYQDHSTLSCLSLLPET
jgi:hypothetical protein